VSARSDIDLFHSRSSGTTAGCPPRPDLPVATPTGTGGRNTWRGERARLTGLVNPATARTRTPIVGLRPATASGSAAQAQSFRPGAGLRRGRTPARAGLRRGPADRPVGAPAIGDGGRRRRRAAQSNDRCGEYCLRYTNRERIQLKRLMREIQRGCAVTIITVNNRMPADTRLTRRAADPPEPVGVPAPVAVSSQISDGLGGSDGPNHPRSARICSAHLYVADRPPPNGPLATDAPRTGPQATYPRLRSMRRIRSARSIRVLRTTGMVPSPAAWARSRKSRSIPNGGNRWYV
jgi:hypothetical protein